MEATRREEDSCQRTLMEKKHCSRAKLQAGTHKHSTNKNREKGLEEKKGRSEREKRDFEICRIPIKAACPPEPHHQMEERCR